MVRANCDEWCLCWNFVNPPFVSNQKINFPYHDFLFFFFVLAGTVIFFTIVYILDVIVVIPLNLYSSLTSFWPRVFLLILTCGCSRYLLAHSNLSRSWYMAFRVVMSVHLAIAYICWWMYLLMISLQVGKKTKTMMWLQAKAFCNGEQWFLLGSQHWLFRRS